LPILIIIFIAFIGLVCSPSISFLSNNYVTRSHQAFAAKDDSSDDGGSRDSSDDGGSRDSSDDGGSRDSSDDGGSRDSSTGSFETPPVETPPVETPSVETPSVETPPVETPPPPPPPIEEPTQTLIAPPPPPPPTCEQGSTSPECAKVPEPPGPPVQTAPPANNEGGSAPPANEGDGTDDGATGAGSVPFIPISPTNPSDNKEGNAIEQGAQAVSTQTDTTNEDAFQRGVKDAGRDLQGLNGHKFDDSCPKGHTAAFCDEYKQGYHERYYDTTDNDSPSPTKPKLEPVSSCPSGSKLVNGKCETQPHPDDDCLFNPSLSKCKSIGGQCPKAFFLNGDDNCVPDKKCPKGFETHSEEETGTCHPVKKPTKAPLHSVGGGGNGTPNINIVDNRQQQKVIVKVNTKVDTVTKNVIVNNLATASSQGKQPTFLLLLDTAQLCQLAGDAQCVTKQNQFKTLNLVTRLDSTGKSWTISGQADNVAAGAKTQRNVQVIAYFYDSKGNNVGGSYQGAVNPTVLKSLQSGVFNFKSNTSTMKGTPSFLRLEYQSIAP
jgi:hypothetical protein